MKLYICPTCKTTRPWRALMSEIAGKGIKNPKRARSKEHYIAMAKKSAEVRKKKKEVDPLP